MTLNKQKNKNKIVSEPKMVLLTRFWNCNRINEELRAFWVNRILLYSNEVDFHPPMHFQEVFGRYLWNGPSMLKIEENEMHLGRTHLDPKSKKNAVDFLNFLT